MWPRRARSWAGPRPRARPCAATCRGAMRWPVTALPIFPYSHLPDSCGGRTHRLFHCTCSLTCLIQYGQRHSFSRLAFRACVQASRVYSDVMSGPCSTGPQPPSRVKCVPEHVSANSSSRYPILVAGAIPLTPAVPASTRISARLKRVQTHSSSTQMVN